MKVLTIRKRIASGILTLFMLVACALPAFSLDIEEPVEPIVPEAPYVTIRSTDASIKVSGTTATCYAKVTSQKSASLKLKMVLQKKSGSTWSTVETWNSSKTGTSLSSTNTKTVSSGGTYRLKVTFTAGAESTTQIVYP